MNIETIILAGGKSSRMGKDKALLTFQEKPLLTNIYEQVSLFSQQVYIVTPWSEKYMGLIPDDCIFIKEEKIFQGPLAAFAEALEYTDADWIFLLACDLPYLNLAPIQTWLRQLSELPADAIAFLARNKKGWECLCGFYRRSCLASLKEHLDSGNRSFQSWLSQKKVIPILVKNQNIFFNCNTVEDYLKIKSEI